MSPFGGWFDEYYESVFAPAVEEAGLRSRRADDMWRPSAIVHDIWRLINESAVLLADLTDRNPNVFYELGLAHALGKPVVLTAQDIADVPFDLRALRVIEYETRSPSWAQTLRGAITESLGEVMEEPADAVLAPFLHTHPSSAPSVGEDEGRLRSIEDELAHLRALVRSATSNRREPQMPASEARRQVEERLGHGDSPEHIMRDLHVRWQVPLAWLGRELGRRAGLTPDEIARIKEAVGSADRHS